MNYTNEKSLHNCYSRLYAKILEQQMGTNDTTFSFHHGIPKDQEGYKYSVWEKAHKIISKLKCSGMLVRMIMIRMDQALIAKFLQIFITDIKTGFGACAA